MCKLFESSSFQRRACYQLSSLIRIFSSETATIDVDVMTAASSIKFSHVLSFVEPNTGVPVKLVGAMHYNPHSIEVARVSSAKPQLHMSCK
jgi:hypothetical protein